MEREQVVLELAREAGFDLAGLAPLAPPPAAERFESWLAAGRHGSMTYLERNRERIVDPRRILPAGRSLLVVGLGHSRPGFELPDGARVARYAAGRDYHNVLGKRLRKLGRRLAREGWIGRSRTIVDAGPLLERSHAAVAGLGFESKAANLLHPAFGPWFFLGELILDVELEPTTAPDAPPAGSCGTCTACIDACPTRAILEPGVVDARECLSYQTIENRGAIPRHLRENLGSWAFGCDVCSEVCPWGDKAPDLSARYGEHGALTGLAEAGLAETGPAENGPAEAGLVSWIETPDQDAFAERFRGSPLSRPRREGLARNAALVLGNRPTDLGHRALLRALSFDPSALVREAAAWALARGHRDEPRTRSALESARSGDPDEWVRVEVQRSLADDPDV